MECDVQESVRQQPHWKIVGAPLCVKSIPAEGGGGGGGGASKVDIRAKRG